MVVLCRHLQIVVQIFRTGTRLFHAHGHGSSVQSRVENGRNQKANFMLNNAEGSRNTLQGSFELSL